LEFKIIDVSTSDKELEVILAYDEVKDDINKEVQKQSKKIQMPGFRKGKVPVSMLKKMYGDALEYEAAEKVANSQFWKIAKENGVNPVGQPVLIDMKFEPGSDLSFKVKYEIIPELTVKDYTGNDIEIPDLTVQDKAVDEEVKHILKLNSTNEEVDQVGEDNNYVVNLELFRVDEKETPMEGVQPQIMDIDLSNERVQKDLVEKARGKKVDESFVFSFTDKRNDKSEEGEEKEIVEVFYYKANIKNIKKIVAPELTEELIKKVTKNKAADEEGLRAQIRNDIQSYLNEQTEKLLRSKLITVAIEKNDFTPPSSLVENFLDDLVKQDEADAKKQGYKSFDKEAARKSYKDLSEREVKWFLIKRAIEKLENISVTEEELKNIAQIEAEKIGLPVDKLLNYYKSSNYGDSLLNDKLFDMLKGKNNIKKVPPEKYTKKEKD